MHAGSSDDESAVFVLVERARTAQAQIAAYRQEEVDALTTAIAWSVVRPDRAEALAQLAVDEGGFGNFTDKVVKIRNRIVGTLADMAGLRTVGVVEESPERGLVKIAKPALRFDARRGLELLSTGDAAATDLAEVLVVDCGLDFRKAHRLVGTLVRQAAGRRPLAALSVDELSACSIDVLGHPVELTPAALTRALDPKESVRARTGPGGAAPPALDAVLAEQRYGLAEIQAWTAQQQERQRVSEASLLQQCRERCGA